MEIIMYSTHCPRCNVLAKKLQQKNIEYTTIDDVEIMTNLGFLNVPILVVNGGAPMEFKEANDWVNSLEV